MTASPMLPGVGACTPGSLLCPLDGAQDDAYAALDDAQATIEGVPDAADGVVPAALAAEQEALNQEEQARASAMDAAMSGANGAFDEVAGAEDTAVGAVGTAADMAASTVMGAGGTIDSSLTDTLLSADRAVGTVLGVEAAVGQIAGDELATVPGTVADATDPVVGPVSDFVNNGVPAIVGDLTGDVGRLLDIGFVFTAYDDAKGTLLGGINYDYSLIQGRFPTLLPPVSALQDAEANLP